MLKTGILSLIILLPSILLGQQCLTQQDYISHYKNDAVKDMVKTHVPASITLAQGILESESGNSDLAQLANNHFGIKCHKEWSGDTYHKDDDERQECFRKYHTALESFDDHSDFLHTRDRYEFLFHLNITDYKGWARGLKKAGYATNPRYAQRLIDLIENFNLSQFDKLGQQIMAGKNFLPDPTPIAVQQPASSAKTETVTNVVENNPTENKVSAAKNNSVAKTEAPKPRSNTFYAEQNNVKYIISKSGDTWLSIAKENEMMLWQVLKYNDSEKDDPIIAGTVVFIKPKRASSKTPFHVVQPGETLRDISQLYAVKLNHLYKTNRIEPGTQLVAGTKIFLNDSGNNNLNKNL
jgi:LysM repeat protein